MTPNGQDTYTTGSPMIRSMTGFGAGTAESDGESVVVELRSVNSRHLKLNFRLPPGCDRWESDLRDTLAGSVGRGHVDVTVRVDRRQGIRSSYRLDEDRVQALVEGVAALKERYDLPGDVDLGMLLSSDRILVEDTSGPGDTLDVDVVVRAGAGAPETHHRGAEMGYLAVQS